jgi:hypothetical protein
MREISAGDYPPAGAVVSRKGCRPRLDTDTTARYKGNPEMILKSTLAAALGLILVLANHTKGHLINVSWTPYLVWPLSAAAAVWIASRFRGDSQADDDAAALPALILLLATAVFLFSSATAARNFFLVGWAPPDPSLFDFRGGLARSALMTALLTPLCLYTGGRRWLLLLALLLTLEFLLFRELAQGTGWAALYRDDHPSFMYRFWSYARSFPRYFYYDPLWNAGGISGALVSSGMTPMGMVFWPFWRFAPTLAVYTPIVGFSFIVLLPWLAVGSARLMGAGRQASLSAGILSLGFCWYFTLYLIKFGTVGSLFSTIFLLPVCALLYRVLWLEKREVWAGALLVVSSFFFLSWPAAAFLAPLVVLAVVLSARRWTKKNVGFLGACTVAIVVLLLPMYLGLHSHTDIGGFVEADNAVRWDAKFFTSGWRMFRAQFAQANPLLIFLGLAGLFFTRRRGMIPFLGPILFGALLLASWGKYWKPILQLDRMGVPLFLAASLPAAFLCGQVLETKSRRWAPARALLLALLAAGGLAGVRHYDTFSRDPHVAVSPVMLKLVDWIGENTDGDSRILFAGKTAHGYGGGHVALLPALTGREMIAGDYYAFSPKLVEHERPPKAWRKRGREGIREYMDLYNVGHVMTFNRRWKEHFREEPSRYRELASFMQRKIELTVFKVVREPSFFSTGSGTVTSGINRIEVHPDSPGEVVLKYNWEEGLSTGGKAEIFPVEMSDGVTFIGARPVGKEGFTIRYDKWL